MILTTEGKNLILQKIVSKVEGKNFILHLYKNDYKPKKSSTIYDFQELDQDKGYAQNTMHALFWDLDMGKVKSMEKLFAFSGRAGNIFGWYITEGDIVIWAKKFEEKVVIKRNGDKLKLSFQLGIK